MTIEINEKDVNRALRVARMVAKCDCQEKGGSIDNHFATIICNNHDRMVEENKKLLIALCDIQGMCIGDIAMGYKLDPESIGMMIYKATGMTHPELSAKLNQEGEE